MMHEIVTLARPEWLSLYGINRFLHTKDQKAKRQYRLLAAVWIWLLIIVAGYVGGLVWTLCETGLSAIVPTYLGVMASMLIFIFGLFKAGYRIFGQKGYDILASLPVRSSSLVISRFWAMYTEDLFLTLTIFVPGVTVYGIVQHPKLVFYVIALVGILLIPILPLVLSTVLGTLIMALSSRLRHKSLIQTVLMVALVIGILSGSIGLSGFSEELSIEQLASMAASIGDLLGQLYPPAVWLGNAMRGSSFLWLLWFFLLSVGALMLCIMLTARFFSGIMQRLSSITATHSYKIGELKQKGLLRTLYIREMRRYFSSSVYVTNTIIGPIMGCIASAALCFAGMDRLQGIIPFDITGAIPFVFSAVFCMMTTTACSISMEGRQFWVIKSLPISAKTLFDSKILLNLSLMLPCYLLAEVFLIIAVSPEWIELIWLLLIPGLMMLFSTVFGITVDIKLHRFDWEKEEQVVKQGAAAGLGGFSGMLLSAVLGVAVNFVPGTYANFAKLGVCLLVAGGTAWLYYNNNRKRLETLE